MLDTVRKALRILELFDGTGAPLRLRDVSAALDCAPSSAHRMLATLAHLGYVRRDKSHAYYEGDALAALAGNVATYALARAAAGCELQHLLSCTNGSASYVVLRDAQVYFVAAARQPGIPPDKPAVGASLRLTTSASGRALLAAAGQAECNALLRATSVTARDALASELQQVRSRGFATSFGETAPGVNAIASPITSRSGRVYGALTVVVHGETMWRDELFALGAEVRESCRRVADQLP